MGTSSSRVGNNTKELRDYLYEHVDLDIKMFLEIYTIYFRELEIKDILLKCDSENAMIEKVSNLVPDNDLSKMADILITASDEIKDFGEFLSSMISYSVDTDGIKSKIIDLLYRDFFYYKLLSDKRRRIAMLIDNQLKALPIKRIQYIDEPSGYKKSSFAFRHLRKAYKYCIDICAGKETTENFAEFKKMDGFFSKSSVQHTLILPDSSKSVETITIHSHSVFRHGISSNGTFLFILSYNYIYMFLLGQGGILLEPLKVGLKKFSEEWFKQLKGGYNIAFSAGISITASQTELTIYDRHISAVFKISDLLKVKDGEDITKFSFRKSKFRYAISNGVTHIGFDDEWRAFITYEGSKDKTILDLNNIVKCSNKPDPLGACYLPPIRQDQYITVTDGFSLAILSHYRGSKYFIKYFNIPAGEFIGSLQVENIYYSSLCLDSLNHCYYAVERLPNGVTRVLRIPDFGSTCMHLLNYSIKRDDSIFRKSIVNNFLRNISYKITSFIGNHYYHPIILTEIDRVDEYLSFIKVVTKALNVEMQKSKLKAILESASAIIFQHLYLLNKSNVMEQRQLFRNETLEFIRCLPVNIAFSIYFPFLDFFINDDASSIDFLIDLYSKVEEDDRLLIKYSTYYLELSKALPQHGIYSSNKLKSVHPRIGNDFQSIKFSRFFIAYQRALATFESETRSNQQISSYFEFLCTEISLVMSEVSSADEFVKTKIFMLFDNFVRILHSLGNDPNIASIILFFQRPVSNFLGFLRDRKVNLSESRILTNTVETLLYLYGLFLASHMKGYSDNESKLLWLIKANVNKAKNPGELKPLLNRDLKNVSPVISGFLIDNKQKYSMDRLYNSYKRNLNKPQLVKDYLFLDKLFVIAILNHMGSKTLKKFFGFLNGEVSKMDKELESVASSMMRIRNHYRSIRQKAISNEKIAQESTNRLQDIETRAYMLLKLNSSFKDNKSNIPVQISDFIMNGNEPSSIIEVLTIPSSRNTILDGFFLVTKKDEINDSYLLDDIITFHLSRMVLFDGLSTIFSVSDKKSDMINNIKSFFENNLDQITTRDNERYVITAYNFFRSIDFIDEIKYEYLNKLVEKLNQNNGFHLFYNAFALAVFLALTTSQFNESWLSLPSNKYNLFLLYVSAPKIKMDDEILKMLSDRLFLEKDTLKIIILYKTILRLLFSDSLKASAEVITEFLTRILREIGASYIKFVDVDRAFELSNIPRAIIINGGALYEILINIVKSNRSKATICVGFYGSITNYISTVYSFCIARYHVSRESYSNALYMKDDQSSFVYFTPISLPVKFESIVDDGINIYSIPRVSCSPEAFLDFDFVLSDFDRIMSKNGTIIKSVYIQALGYLLSYSENVKKISPKMISVLAKSISPFITLPKTISLMFANANKKYISKCFCSFNLLTYFDKYIGLLSPQIKMDGRKFDVIINTNNDYFQGYIGIISDFVEPENVRYNLLKLPDGKTIPFNRKGREFTLTNRLLMTIDTERMVYIVDGNELMFPVGKSYRILIQFDKGVKNFVDLSNRCKGIEFQEDNFIKNGDGIFSLQERGFRRFYEGGELFQYPSWADEGHPLPDNALTIPDFTCNISALSMEQKARANFVQPYKAVILIHPDYTTGCSKPIMDELANGIRELFSSQWSTIALTRIIAANPNIDLDKVTFVRLFSILTVQLEKFEKHKFTRLDYPYTLNYPVWSDFHRNSTIFLSMDMESKFALNNMVNQEDFNGYSPMSVLEEAIKSMSNDPFLHLCAYPNPAHKYYPPGTIKDGYLSIDSPSIIFPNSFAGYIEDFIEIDDRYYSSPFIYQTVHKKNLRLKYNQKYYGLSILKIGLYHNMFMFDTPFELLALIKSFVFMPKQSGQFISKISIIKSILVSSPSIFCYLPQWMDLLQTRVPIDTQNYGKFKRDLFVLGSSVNKLPKSFSSRIFLVYFQEHLVLSSPLALMLKPVFPEFGHTQSSLKKDKIVIDVPILHGGNLKAYFGNGVSVRQYLMKLKLFSRNYISLSGFPFWEIFPFWYRLSSFYKDSDEIVVPQLTRIQSNQFVLTNYSGLKCRVLFFLNRKCLLNVYYSEDNFNADLIQVYRKYSIPSHFAKRHPGLDILFDEQVTEPVKYYTFIDSNGDPYRQKLDYEFIFDHSKNTSSSGQKVVKNIDDPQLHKEFYEDMKQFALQWESVHTEYLLFILAKKDLLQPTFKSVREAALDSNISKMFSERVILLHALLLYHFHFIKHNLVSLLESTDFDMNEYQYTREFIDSSNDIICFEETSEDILKYIYVTREDYSQTTFIINRKRAQFYMASNIYKPQASIVFQFCEQIRTNLLRRGIQPCDFFSYKFGDFPNKKIKLVFHEERALDGGGLSKEFLSDFAASLFHPSSGLTIPMIDNINKIGGETSEYFLPYGNQPLSLYETIGLYLGLVLRSGYYQDIPFPPIVWKYIATSDINGSDILGVDTLFREKAEKLRDCVRDGIPIDLTWEMQQWDGSVTTVPGYTESDVIRPYEVEHYINKVVEVRIESLLYYLRYIRKGLMDNIRTTGGIPMTGVMLSYLCQGSGVITLSQLQTSSTSTGSEEHIKIFWQAIAKFNKEQLKSFLKFVTGTSRIPNSSKFSIKIVVDDSKPPTSLPRSATCFSTVYIPPYPDVRTAFEKIKIALAYCNTMELT